MVRSFASWLEDYDANTEIPSAQLIPGKYKRRTPYIYSRKEIFSIVNEAGRLSSDYGLRASMWQTAFGLISVTGMRVSEAIQLTCSDVDLPNSIISVRQGKNRKPRILPIKPCVVKQLKSHAELRDKLIDSSSERFFLKEDGIPPTDCAARYNFSQVGINIGLSSKQRYNRHGLGPRIHDLRHTFAVHTILDWFQSNRNIEKEMYKLSSYLGHTKPKHTYWYIEAIPELMNLAAERSEIRLLEGRV
jgi:integrase